MTTSSQEKRVSTGLLKRFLQPRQSKAAATVTVVGVMALMAMQNMGTAAASTDAARADHVEGCLSGQACLWINAPNDPDPIKAADRRALVITPGNDPDLDQETPDGLGKVHGMGAEFTDNISVGWNNLPTELCLLDTEEYEDGEKFGTKAPLRHTTRIIVVPPWSDFSYLGESNDTADYYATGGCPRHDIVFRADTEAIINAY
jgi:hypothetical protein